MIRNLINKKYIIYGLSLIFSRGIELLILFYTAKLLSKNEYGELEFYKKVIELGGAFVSFGFPALILTYTRSDKSKLYMFSFASFISVSLIIILLPVLLYMNLTFLSIPILFYALFFTGSITQSYILVRYNSDMVSYYKIIISFLFYLGVLVTVVWFQKGKYAYVLPAYILFPVFYLLSIREMLISQFNWSIFIKYYKHFTKLLSASFSLVINNFSNIMFLYTDIFLIKYLSNKPNIEIADYSFSLNVANILIMIPLTLVQVDIEKLKIHPEYFKKLNKKIITLVVFLSLFLAIFYYIITKSIFIKYQNTLILFLILLIAKIFQSFSTINGTSLLIRKKFNITVIINLIMIIVNVVISFILYPFLGLYGIALTSLICLVLRFIVLNLFRKKYF